MSPIVHIIVSHLFKINEYYLEVVSKYPENLSAENE